MATTTKASREAARALMRGDWDRGGTVTIGVPFAQAKKLLHDRGWAVSRDGAWYDPEGEGPVWHIEEALTREVVADAMALPDDDAELVEEQVTAKHLERGDRVYLSGELRTVQSVEYDSPRRVRVVATDGVTGFGGVASKYTRVAPAC